MDTLMWIFLSTLLQTTSSQLTNLSLNGTDISDIKYSEFQTTQLPDFSGLPQGCHLQSHTQSIFCEYTAGFPVILEHVAITTKVLQVTRCNPSLKTTLTRADLQYFSVLTSLTIKSCELESIDEDTFLSTPNLKDLDLSDNLLQSLPYTTVLNIKSPTSIHLSGNQFECSCGMKWISILANDARFAGSHMSSIIAGTPKCDNNTIDLKTMTVDNCEAPKTSTANHTSIEELSPGDQVVLSCSSVGVPPPKVNWVTDRLKSSYYVTNNGSTNSTLYITNLSPEDDGIIKCYGRNEAFLASSSVTISMNVPPTIEHMAPEGTCVAYYVIRGTDPYTMIWTFDGLVINPNDRNNWKDSNCKTENTTKCEFHTMKGCLMQRVVHSSGILRLKVTNQFGSDEKTVTITKGTLSPKSGATLDKAGLPGDTTTSLGAIGVDPSTSSGTQKTVLIVTTLLAIMLVGVSILILIKCKQRRCRHKKNQNNISHRLYHNTELAPLNGLPEMMENPTYHILSPTSSTSSRILKVIPCRDVSLIRELGEGAFGRVYLGTCLHLNTGDEHTMVAIKTLKSSVTQEAIRNFEYEAEVMADIHHENIVLFYGICYKEENIMMIFEYMEQGDLNNFLRKVGPDAESLGFSLTNQMNLLPEDLLYIAKQIAAGMAYLANRHFVHRDLATRNCLVGERLIVKIGDFGMSRDIYSSDYYKVGEQTLLPIRWMPPESVLYRKFTTESDVWSYGVVLWEIFSFGRQPWFELSNMEVIEHIKDGKLLSKPDNCHPEMYKLMCGCWKYQPAERVKMSVIHDTIKGMLTPESPYNNNTPSQYDIKL